MAHNKDPRLPPPVTFDEYVIGAHQYYLSNIEHQRIGQAYMNHLHSVCPDLYHAIPWDIDPFYEDKYMNVFLTYVQDHWEVYNHA